MSRLNTDVILNYIKENFRFLLAALANVLALSASVWWLVDSNFNDKNAIEIEPIVSTITLTATLLGLNFVNNKLSKPLLKIKLSISFAQSPIYGNMQGMNITVENHSIFKTFISQFQIEIPQKNQVTALLYGGFTSQVLPKVVLEPGQSFSFNVVKENIYGTVDSIEEFGRLVVKTDIGHKFYVSSDEVRRQIGYLFES